MKAGAILSPAVSALLAGTAALHQQEGVDHEGL
jgi:hypothetical protein